MKKTMKGFAIYLITMAATLFLAVPTFAASGFSDVGQYWATDAINWAAKIGIVTGVGNNLFAPTKTLTEAEFAVMLCRMGNVQPVEESTAAHWAQPYYNALKPYALPLDGYADNETANKNKSKTISRGKVARIIAAKDGFNLNMEQAVYFMYSNNLSSGMSSVKTYENYGVNNTLTRDQAAVFMQRIYNSDHTTFGKEKSKTKGPNITGIANEETNKFKIDIEEYSLMAPLTSGQKWKGMDVLSYDQRQLTYQAEIEPYMSRYREDGTFNPVFKGADGKPDFSLTFGIAHAKAIEAEIGVNPANVSGYLWFQDPRFYSSAQGPIVDKAADGRYHMAYTMPFRGPLGSFTYNPANQNGKTLTTMAQVDAIIKQPGILDKLDAKTQKFLYNVLKLSGTTVIDTNIERVQQKMNYTGVEHVNGGAKPAPFVYGVGDCVFFTDSSRYGVGFFYDQQTTGADTDKPIGFTVFILQKMDTPTDYGDFKQYFEGGDFWEISLDHDFTDDVMFR